MPGGSGRRVFVVDDERLIADTLAIILCRAGYSAIPLYSGQEAVDAAMNQPPDLIISDVAMPEMTGVELAILLNSWYPTCKILLFSGQANTQNILKAAREDGYDFELLTKPVHPADLLAKIGQLHQNTIVSEELGSV